MSHGWPVCQRVPGQRRGNRSAIRARQLWRSAQIGVVVGGALLVGLFLDIPNPLGVRSVAAAQFPGPTHSTTIALTSTQRRVLVVNREANSLSVIRVRLKATTNHPEQDIAVKLAEIPVGLEPRCVAVSPNDLEAYVTNGISGTVSVVSLEQLSTSNVPARFEVVATIPVGTEPRGCALTADGTLLYVANHTAGTVSIIDTASRAVVGTVPAGPNPTAIAITNRGTGHISDDTVFVTQIFAELDPAFSDPTFNGNGEARDLGKHGVVHAFPAGNANPPITKITLSPLPDSGFSASRTNFCPKAMGAQPHSLIFCPDPNVPGTDDVNANNPQGVYANQLLSAVIRGNRLYVTAIGPQPEPPEIFNANVQALVYVVDTDALAEVAVGDKTKNLNVQIAVETAAPPPSLDKTFANDIVAIDANLAGDTFVIVSRGGNQVFRAKLADPATGQLNILNTAGTRVDCRIQTGNLPSGVAMRKDGTRAYANNEANFSVTSMNIEDGVCLTLQRDITSSEPPAPGSFDHAVLVGKLAFFTALGIPDNDIFGTDIRDIIPRDFKGKMSKDAWSSCGSCHPDGLADGVTWIFGTGPRQTKPLDGMFNKGINVSDQGLLNWSAIRGSNTDFNANSRGVQGGCGFASDDFDPGQCFAKGNTTLANPAIYDHGITQGASEALDAQTLWIFAAVRPLNQPQPDNVAGRARGLCGQLRLLPRGGQVDEERDLPPRQPRRRRPERGRLGPRRHQAPPDAQRSRQTRRTSSSRSPATAHHLAHDQVSRGCGDVRCHQSSGAPRQRHRQHGVWGEWVQRAVVAQYQLPRAVPAPRPGPDPGGGVPAARVGTGRSGFPPTTTIQTQLTALQRSDLLVFLKSIDGTTPHFRSAGDDFRDALRLTGPCQ